MFKEVVSSVLSLGMSFKMGSLPASAEQLRGMAWQHDVVWQQANSLLHVRIGVRWGVFAFQAGGVVLFCGSSQFSASMDAKVSVRKRCHYALPLRVHQQLRSAHTNHCR